MQQLFVVTGPTAVGKTRIVDSAIEHQSESFAKFITTTSREPRMDDRHGVSYYLRNPAQFQKKIQENAFFEYEEVFDNVWYGCERLELLRIQELLGKTAIVVTDVNGALKLMGKRKQGFCDLTGISVTGIFISAPVDELIARLHDDVATGKRKNDPKDIEKRINRMPYEASMAEHFDYVINNANGKFPSALNEFINIVSATTKNQPLS